MDFREVCTFFGGSIFQKGCDAILTSLTSKPDSTTSSDLKVQRTQKILSFAARWRQSCQFYEVRWKTLVIITLHLHATISDRWSRRLRGYLRFARSVKSYPPLFRFKPRVSGPTTLLTMTEDPDLAPESKTAMRQNMNIGIMMIRADDKPIDLDILEQALLFTIWNLNHTALSASQAINPKFLLEEQQTIVQGTVEVLDLFRSQFHLAGLLIISNYVFRLLFELEDRSCLPNAEASFRRLRDDYTNDKDEIGIAICDLIFIEEEAFNGAERSIVEQKH